MSFFKSRNDSQSNAERAASNASAGAAEADPSVQTASFAALDELLAALPELVRPGDCVLVKASHSMAFERIVQALTQN